MRPMAWAPEATVTTRAGALGFNRSSSRLVSRNGARWLSAKVCSSPSAVMCRVYQLPPTLFTRTRPARVRREDLRREPPHLGL